MLTCIVVPNQKLFVPAGLMLRQYFLTQGAMPIIVCGATAARIFEQFEVPVQPHDFLQTLVQTEAHLVHIQLNSPGVKNSFFKSVKALGENCERIKITLWPDGLGNASWGERLDLQYIAEFGDEGIDFAGFLSFGFVHSTTKELAGDCPIAILDYDLLHEAIRSSESIQNVIAPAAASLMQESSIIIPFRPWCTEQFHGGIYDFGSASDLSRIYSDLIRIANSDGFASSPIFFRPDDRFQKESDLVMSLLREQFEVVDLSELYPQWLTLEPLLSAFLSIKNSKPLAMINLDSTSFQSVPFLSKMEAVATGYIGAPSSSLEKVSGGNEFVEKKLTGKIRDFERRYSYFQDLKRVRSVEQLEQNLLKVCV